MSVLPKDIVRIVIEHLNRVKRREAFDLARIQLSRRWRPDHCRVHQWGPGPSYVQIEVPLVRGVLLFTKWPGSPRHIDMQNQLYSNIGKRDWELFSNMDRLHIEYRIHCNRADTQWVWVSGNEVYKSKNCDLKMWPTGPRDHLRATVGEASYDKISRFPSHC